jgi:hypothetical protein
VTNEVEKLTVPSWKQIEGSGGRPAASRLLTKLSRTGTRAGGGPEDLTPAELM